MAARIRLLQVAIAIVNLVIVGLVFTSIWPFPSGDIKVHLPSANEVQWSYANGVVHVTAPFSIDNGWIYDIDDLSIEYQVTNDSRARLVQNTIVVGSVPAKQLMSSALDFTFDLLALYNQNFTWMVFHDDMLYFFIEVICGYTMKLVGFDATYQVSVPWDALIQSYGISDVTYPTSMPAPGNPVSVSISYWLSTSNLLEALPPAQVTVSYYGNATLLGRTQTTIELGGNHTGVLSMDITPLLDLNATYSVQLTTEFAGFPPMSKTYTAPSPWGLLP